MKQLLLSFFDKRVGIVRLFENIIFVIARSECDEAIQCNPSKFLDRHVGMKASSR